MAGCRLGCGNLGILCGSKLLAFAVLQHCLCSSGGLAFFCTGRINGICRDLSLCGLLVIALGTGEHTGSGLVILAPLNLALIVMAGCGILVLNLLGVACRFTVIGSCCSVFCNGVFGTGCLLFVRCYLCCNFIGLMTACSTLEYSCCLVILCPIECNLISVLAGLLLNLSRNLECMVFCCASSCISQLDTICACTVFSGNLCCRSNRLLQCNLNGIIIYQTIQLILLAVTNGGANQILERYRIGAVIVLGPLGILCRVGVASRSDDFIVLCLFDVILRLLLFIAGIRGAPVRVFIRFCRLLYCSAADGANIAFASVPFSGIAVLCEVGLIEMNVVVIACFLLVRNALVSQIGHLLRTLQVGNPHKLIIVVDFFGVAELLHHGIIITGVIVAVIRVVVALLERIAVAVLLTVCGIIVLGGAGAIILAGDVCQIGSNRNIQLSVIL